MLCNALATCVVEIKLQTKANEALSLGILPIETTLNIFQKTSLSPTHTIYFLETKKIKNAFPEMQTQFKNSFAQSFHQLQETKNSHANTSKQMSFHSSSQFNLQQSNNNQAITTITYKMYTHKTKFHLF
jgi:hypothetical protein